MLYDGSGLNVPSVAECLQIDTGGTFESVLAGTFVPQWLVGFISGTTNPLTFGTSAENQWGLLVLLSILIR